MPLAQRVNEGRALGPLRVAVATKRRLTLVPETTAAPFAPCLLREGDFVRLSPNTPVSPHAHAILLGEDHDGIHLELRDGALKPALETGWTIDPDFIDLTSLFSAAIDALAVTQLGRERVLPLLMGLAGSELDAGRFEEVMDAFAEQETDDSQPRWHDSQQEAIAACVAAREAFLVQGPPGTGKTRVLAEVARTLLAGRQWVLVTGPTHRAIQQSLLAIRRAVPASIRVAKIGPAPLGGEAIECHETGFHLHR